MDKKKAKRRRTTRWILAFFVLLWLGLSVRIYLRDTGAAKVYTRRGWNSKEVHVGVVKDGDGYRCDLDVFGGPFDGHFVFEHEYKSYASRTRAILKEEWDITVVRDRLPAGADKEKVFDEGYALLVAQGVRRNWPNITRAQAKNYVVEYPKRQSANKRAIALHSFKITAPGLAILCGFVLVVRYVWFVAHERPPPGVCPDCDYNLGGLKDKKCPECGRGFDDKEWRFHMSG